MNHKTPYWTIFTLIIGTGLSSLAQYLLKKGITNAESVQALVNPSLIIGIILYMVFALIMIIVLKNGELSVLYPIISLGFVWVALISIFLLNERLALFNYGGIFFIIIGISVIGYGSKND